MRQFLHEDEDGNLFADNMMEEGGGSNKASSAASKTGGGKGKGAGGDERWALASFFGEEQHALLCLRDEARDLLAGVVTTVNKVDGPSADATGTTTATDGEVKNEASQGDASPSSDSTPPPNKVNDTNQPNPPFRREPLATVDVPMALALAEHSEQARCKEWGKLILQKSDHPLALVSMDEYSMQLHLEKGKTKDGPDAADEATGASGTKTDQAQTGVMKNSKKKQNPTLGRARIGSNVARSTRAKDVSSRSTIRSNKQGCPHQF